MVVSRLDRVESRRASFCPQMLLGAPILGRVIRKVIFGAFWAFLLPLFAAHPLTAQSETREQPASRSAVEASPNPFLRSFSTSPVHWQLWGNASFDRSRRENKPILLLIGHHASPGFQTLQRKVLAQPEIARFLNDNFVNVLVDREERPDLALIYHAALDVYLRESGSTQHAGWPVVMFLTPEGKPLGGGSSYASLDQGDQPGFLTVLRRINASWREEREQLTRDSDLLTRALIASLQPPASETDLPDLDKSSAELETRVDQALFTNYDQEYGGFFPRKDSGPKLAGSTRLLTSLLLSASAETPVDPRVLKTLDALCDGGLLDHLGGGFFTHSRDREWRIPHFEKRLVDNALLAETFSQAFRLTQNPRYRRAAEESVSFILSRLALSEGGFAVSLGNETPSGDATYYLWTREEIQETLPPEEFAVIRRYYALNDSPHLDRYYVLCQAQPLDTIADDLGLSLEQAELRLKQGQTRLLDVRQRRTLPSLDKKVLLAPNGIAIRSLVRSGMLLNRPEYLREAEKTALFLLTNLRDDGGRLQHVWMSGAPHGHAFLEDYASLIQGLLALYQATEDDKWLNASIRLQHDQAVYFRDDAAPGYFQTPRDHEDLLVRFKPWREEALPSGNSIAFQNQINLSLLAADSAINDQVDRSWQFLAPAWAQEPQALPSLLISLNNDRTGRNSDSVVRVTQGGGSRRMVTLAAAQKQPLEQDPPSKNPRKKDLKVDATVFLSVDRLPPGEKVPFIIRLQIEKNWHINANQPGNEFAVPTELEFESAHDTALFKTLFPKGQKVKEPELEGFTNQYSGQVDIKGLIEVPTAAAGQKEKLTWTISFQACNAKTCLKPEKLTVTIPIQVAAENENVNQIHQDLFKLPQK